MPFEFIFLRPWWLVLIPFGFVLAFAVTRIHSDSWRRVCDSELFSELTMVSDRISERMVWLAIVLGWLLAVLALAGPAWDRDKALLYKSADAMVIVFDLSQSMGSTDLQPSRLERARYKALEVVELQNDKSVGLVVFAGDAFDVTPISDDIRTIEHLLRSLQIQMIPVQGSQASSGLRRAMLLLDNSGYQTGTVVLFTDGVDEDAFLAAENLRQKGYFLSVIAVGTETGSPISLPNGDFLKDSSGKFIVSPVDYRSLAELASTGGGAFSLVSEPFSESLLQKINFGTSSLELTVDEYSKIKWNDQGPWILLALLPLVALIFRRGWILSLMLFFSVGMQQSHALEWDDLWQRSDQQAAEAVRNNDFDNHRLTKHSEWLGIAHYRQNRFEEATVEFSRADDKVAKFNTGNSMARLYDILGAIEQYEAALKIDPEFEDAKFNLGLMHQLLQQQQQRQGESRGSDEALPGNEQQTDQPGENLDRVSPVTESSENEAQEKDEELKKEENQMALSEESFEEEKQQLMEQWLRVIPDDPAGLLRNRFLYEYKLREPIQRSVIAW